MFCKSITGCDNLAAKKCRDCGEFYCIFHIANHTKFRYPNSEWKCNTCSADSLMVEVDD